MKLFVAAFTWMFWPLAAIGAAVAFRAFFEALHDWTRKPEPRRVVLTVDEPEQPRTVTVQREHGVVEVLRFDREPVVHGEGSDWR